VVQGLFALSSEEFIQYWIG